MLYLLNDLNTDSFLLVFMTTTHVCYYVFVHHVFLLLVYSPPHQAEAPFHSMTHAGHPASLLSQPVSHTAEVL